MEQDSISAMKWNDRLAAARKAKGVTKSELARRVKVSPAAVTDWENGKIAALKSESLMRVCRALDLSEEYLLYGTEPQEENAARSLGMQAQTAGELRLLSVYRIANQREREAIDDTVETIRLMIEARTSGDKGKRRG